jgi:hypothetical protein
VVQRKEKRRLLNVGVVSRPPLDLRQRRIRTEPFLARHGRPGPHFIRIGPVALHLVEPADRIVAVRDEEHVVRHPAVVEPVGPHARHAALGHLHHVVLGERPPLAHHDRIDVVVVRSGTGRRIEIRLRLVQIVDDGRMPFERLLRHGLRQLEELSHAVAVVVVLDVFAPIHQRQPRVALRALLVEVVGVDFRLAAVDFDYRRDERDHVLADVLNERRLFDRQAVGELDQHLGAAGLRRVHPADRVINRLRRVKQLLRLRFGGLARIGEGAEHVAILIDRLDRRLVGDREQHDVAPFFGRANLPVLHPRRRFRERLVISLNVLRVRQLARRAGNAAEERERRGNGGRGRHVIDELRRDPRILQILLDQPGVLFVLFLRGPGFSGRCRTLRSKLGGCARRQRRERRRERDGRRNLIFHGAIVVRRPQSRL